MLSILSYKFIGDLKGGNIASKISRHTHFRVVKLCHRYIKATGMGQGLLGHYSPQDSVLDRPHPYSCSFLIFHIPRKQFFIFSCCPSFLGGPPSWAISHGLCMLSQACIVWLSHTCGKLVPPPPNGGHTCYS